MLDISKYKSHKYLCSVVQELHPKYNFDATESIFDLCIRMEYEDWVKLSAAIKYPNGVIKAVGNE